MNAFLLNKTQYYIDRSNEYSAVVKYVTGDHKDLVLMKEKANGQPLLAVSSQSGDGKTMLLAKFVLDIEVSSKSTKVAKMYFYFDTTTGEDEGRSDYLLLLC